MPLLAAACSPDQPQQSTTEAAAGPQAGAAAARPGAISTAAAGSRAPDVAIETGPDAARDTVADILRANPGKPVLVNLWATWCAPCIRELPALDRLAAATPGIIVVALSQDMEGWRTVTPFLAQQRLDHLTIRLDSAMRYGLAVGATGLPLTIFYGPDGRERWRYAGDRDWSSPESRRLVAGG